jgi:hypothetical protein
VGLGLPQAGRDVEHPKHLRDTHVFGVSLDQADGFRQACGPGLPGASANGGTTRNAAST